MKIVITGAAGLLGKALIALAPAEHELHKFTCNHHPDAIGNWYSLNLTTGAGLDLIYSIKPDIIIHCAAIGNVDYAQKNHHEAININLSATIDLIKLCADINCKLVNISTNAVFDGHKAPYSDDDLLSPINYYGISKAGAEYAVKYSKIDWIIIRPILMYGIPNQGRRGNWVTVWRDKFRAGQTCQVVNDIITQPLYNADCAKVVWEAIRQQAYGEIFNVAGKDIIPTVDFAYAVADAVKAPRSLIQPVPSSFFPSIAPRPANTTYNLNKINTRLGIYTVGVREGVGIVLGEKPI
ncbi:MAG: NAD(P)-dependent oxidoreductase [Verrucomicrobiota bacterium]